MADPGGGAAGTHPPKGPDSFLLTYKIFETEPPQELAPPYEVGAPLREILDPPLFEVIVVLIKKSKICRSIDDSKKKKKKNWIQVGACNSMVP